MTATTNALSLPQKNICKKRTSRSLYFQILLAVVLIAFVVLPLFAMLTKIDKTTIKNVFSDNLFYKSLLNLFSRHKLGNVIESTTERQAYFSKYVRAYRSSVFC